MILQKINVAISSIFQHLTYEIKWCEDP